MRPYWAESDDSPLPLHRKIWELAFIASALADAGMLKPTKYGLGFGVGKEPLVPLFASLGCNLLATDQAEDLALNNGWSASNQFAGKLEGLNEKGLCEDKVFRKLVSFRTVDMREIPKEITGLDFTWSSCAFEHLGSIDAGLEFVTRQMDCLRPGGVAVHTTEFNVSSITDTITHGPTVLFRKSDLMELEKALRRRGHKVKFDFTLDTTEHDTHIDRPPFSGSHLRLESDGYTITSYGIVIQKGPNATKFARTRHLARQGLEKLISH